MTTATEAEYFVTIPMDAGWQLHLVDKPGLTRAEILKRLTLDYVLANGEMVGYDHDCILLEREDDISIVDEAGDELT